MRFPLVFRAPVTILRLTAGLFLGLHSAAAVPIPPTDNTAPPYMGIYGWALDNPNSGEGMAHISYTAKWLNRSGLWAEEFSASGNWSEITSSWPFKRAAAWLRTHPGTFISTVGMLPVYSGGATLGAGANGSYNSYWTTLAQNIVNEGVADKTIIRLGHEFNATYNGHYAWAPQTRADAFNYAAYFRQIVTTMRAVPGAENLKFCWNGQRQDGSVPYSPADAYPGDEYVDYIGMDIYDTCWNANTYPYSSLTYPYGADALTRQQNAWWALCNTNYGLYWWKNFAAAHGKPLALPEWGTATISDNHGGMDNPYYIQQMYNFIHEPTNNVAFHIYFDVWAGDGNHQLTTLPGKSATKFPVAAALFRKLFGVKPLPTDTDIGTVGMAGNSDPVTVSGAGAGYLSGGTSDNFHFSAGDSSTTNDMLITKITSMSPGTTQQSGLMLRQSTAANSAYAALYVKNGSCIFQSRTSTGAAAAQKFVLSSVNAPVWLKILKRGNSITGYKSDDGKNWVYAGGQTVPMSGTPQFGIAVSSGNTTSLNATGVDSVDNPDIAAIDPGINNAIILDASGTTLPGVARSGSWTGSGTSGYTACFGGDQLFNWSPNTPSAMRFTPTITTAGLYDVYLRWNGGAGYQFADCMPITMTSTSGTDSGLINTKVGDYLWHYLGTYSLGAGTAANLYLNNTGCQGFENGYLRVDAGMFVPVPPPTATIPGAVTGVTQGATTQTSMFVSWNAVAGATSYSFSIRNANTGAYLTSSVSGNTATTTGMAANTWHWIQVRASNSAGYGPWTSVYSCKTLP